MWCVMKRMMNITKKSITNRWIFNNFFVILLILVVIELSFVFAIQSFYYSSAREYMKSRVNEIAGVLTIYSQDNSTNFSGEIREMVESFSDKEKMELMVINSKGKVVLTSSGFSPGEVMTMPDYETMKNNVESIGMDISKQSSGEKVIAMSYPISTINSDYSAIRVVSSLTEIDAHITNLIILVTCVCIVVLLLMMFSGMYFVGSIVKPIQQISNIATKYATGNFSVRIKNDSQDEIGSLCVAINNMADELSTAETMKNEFISSVSHELRTPLTAIKGWAETLNEGDDPEMMQKGIGVIIGETERLSRMVEELLDFSRMQNGRFSLQKENMDILAELGEAVLIYTERARREGLDIIYNEPEMLPIVFGDKSRIKQVFINIIDNAIKYSSCGGTVTIEATENEGNVQIAVADMGCGINETDLSRIKTKFYKANHTKRGSGIGLAVADEIVTMHGGTLTVLSQEGVGTTVVITLPAEKKV